MSGHIWWYTARAAGVVAWLFLTASVLWGIFQSTKILGARKRAAWVLDLHRWLGALTMSFLAIHVVALMADSYVSFDAADVLVPFASDWKSGAVAMGVVAMWVLVAVEMSSLAMKKIPKGAWRGIHLTSYAAFWLTSLHAALAGTDASHPLYIWTSVVSVLAVVFALGYRILAGNGRGRSRSHADRAPEARPTASR